MDKYNKLWIYIKENDIKEIMFNEVFEILGFEIDHAFLKYKTNLEKYGYKVSKISMKNKKIFFEKIEK